MAVIGLPRTFYKKFKFRVEIDAVRAAQFEKCSALEVEAANIQQWEGGAIIPNKSPGRLTFPDVTLQRGATKDLDLFNWFRTVAIAAAGVGLPEPLFKRTADVVQMDRDNSTLRRWTLVGAWPTKFTAGEWDNDADANVIEMVVLAYDFFDTPSL